MILPTIAGAAARGRRDVPRYARWCAAIQELREALEQVPDLAIEGLEPFLAEIPDDEIDQAVQDLVAEHMCHAWRHGRPFTLEQYVERLGGHFKALATVTALPNDLIEDEFLARHILPGGDLPGVEDYARRFPGRDKMMAQLRSRCLRDGRYVKLRRLGRGAVGEVFTASDSKARRLVAIKQLRPEMRGSSGMCDRLALESLITAELDHHGIVRIHEAVDSGDRAPFYVMQLIDGHLLDEEIRGYHFPTAARTRRESRRLWQRLLQACSMVCDAVAHAHDRGVLHRDLKPGNIVLKDSGEAVVLDWGMAERTQGRRPDSPRKHEVVGTPEYMSPELAQGQADRASDVFGLGAVLYEILTGRPPHHWHSHRPADWRRTVLSAQIVRPRKSNSRVPRALESICLTALARDPADRYESAQAMRLALQAQLEPAAHGSRLSTICRRFWRQLAP